MMQSGARGRRGEWLQVARQVSFHVGRERVRRVRAVRARMPRMSLAGFVREYGRRARQWEIKYSGEWHLEYEWSRTGARA